MSSTQNTPAAKAKHRSCDECRTRKLACSKDPTGCERCKRESIACNYSEQKPMGRPRKRQFVETFEQGVANPQEDEGHDFVQVPAITDFLDDFSDPLAAELYYTNHLGLGLPAEVTKLSYPSVVQNNPVPWHFGDSEFTGRSNGHGDIDFSALRKEIPSLSDMQQLSTTPAVSEESSPQSLPLPPCGCLAAMYLALASLQTFPTEIVPALKTIRGAASAASDSIWCPQCGNVAFQPANPPIEGFQNTMLLGTILPIIANGYQRLLQMVDEETDRATSSGSTKLFRFHEYGGMCGKQHNAQTDAQCIELEMFFNPIEMPPHQWRSTVRALLRVDIYGHEQPDYKHKGLKDLVHEMEQRQIARHEVFDAWAMSGQPQTGGLPISNHHHGAQGAANGYPRTCLQIVQMAKIAIDNLTFA